MFITLKFYVLDNTVIKIFTKSSNFVHIRITYSLHGMKYADQKYVQNAELDSKYYLNLYLASNSGHMWIPPLILKKKILVKNS